MEKEKDKDRRMEIAKGKQGFMLRLRLLGDNRRAVFALQTRQVIYLKITLLSKTRY